MAGRRRRTNRRRTRRQCLSVLVCQSARGAVHARVLGIRRRGLLKWSSCRPRFATSSTSKRKAAIGRSRAAARINSRWMRWRFPIATRIGPFAQGDLVVTFINLLNEATVPIVLYRPASAATDLGLYGSSHVGILGGIIKSDQRRRHSCSWTCLKTDYFHAKAYPTYLYYNPHASPKTVEIDVGPSRRYL